MTDLWLLWRIGALCWCAGGAISAVRGRWDIAAVYIVMAAAYIGVAVMLRRAA